MENEDSNFPAPTWEHFYRSYLKDYEDWGTKGALETAISCLQQAIVIRQKDLKEKYCE